MIMPNDIAFYLIAAWAHLDTAAKRSADSLAPRSGERVRERGLFHRMVAVFGCTLAALTVAFAAAAIPLRRYVGNFDFRWNTRKMNDGGCAAAAVQGALGKRLDYRTLTQ
jgi:hypothetical protein